MEPHAFGCESGARRNALDTRDRTSAGQLFDEPRALALRARCHRQRVRQERHAVRTSITAARRHAPSVCVGHRVPRVGRNAESRRGRRRSWGLSDRSAASAQGLRWCAKRIVDARGIGIACLDPPTDRSHLERSIGRPPSVRCAAPALRSASRVQRVPVAVEIRAAARARLAVPWAYGARRPRGVPSPPRAPIGRNSR